MVHDQLKKIDTKELELPETIFVRDVEAKVFQSIVLECLSKIEHVAPIEGNFFDQLLGREGVERVKGIHVEQDEKQHSIKLKIEVNVAYGAPLPKKAEEIQLKVAEEIGRLTGLHVGCVHVVFKNLIPKEDNKAPQKRSTTSQPVIHKQPEKSVSDGVVSH